MKAFLLAVLVLGVAARTKLTFTVAGSLVALPVLWLIAAVVLTALGVALLLIVRSIVRDLRPVLRPWSV